MIHDCWEDWGVDVFWNLNPSFARFHVWSVKIAGLLLQREFEFCFRWYKSFYHFNLYLPFDLSC